MNLRDLLARVQSEYRVVPIVRGVGPRNRTSFCAVHGLPMGTAQAQEWVALTRADYDDLRAAVNALPRLLAVEEAAGALLEQVGDSMPHARHEIEALKSALAGGKE